MNPAVPDVGAVPDDPREANPPCRDNGCKRTAQWIVYWRCPDHGLIPYVYCPLHYAAWHAYTRFRQPIHGTAVCLSEVTFDHARRLP